jgi:hypothetical protein
MSGFSHKLYIAAVGANKLFSTELQACNTVSFAKRIIPSASISQFEDKKE